MKTRLAVSFVFGASLALAGPTLGAADMTLTGTVGDAMCGVKHAIKDAVACTKGCVKKGSDYALIVNDKAYTLKADAAQKVELDKLAGRMATVMGDVSGTTITVKSVKMAPEKK